MSNHTDLLSRIQSHDAVVGIIGLGYVGLPLSVAFAEVGFRTIGLDINLKVVEGATSDGWQRRMRS